MVLEGDLAVHVTRLKLCSVSNERESAHYNRHEFQTLQELARLLALASRDWTALADVDFCGRREIRSSPCECANNDGTFREVHRYGCTPRYGQNRQAV